MNLLRETLAEQIKKQENACREQISGDKYRLKFHLMPPVGWMNDPNGLCQFHGIYHVFFQYSPFSAAGGLKVWGHYTSRDLLNWEYRGTPIITDAPFDCHGVYSGCGCIWNETMHLFYTGNVKFPGKYDYIRAGRGADTVYISSSDGISFSEKQCVLTKTDYKDIYTCHIRDPKVWHDEGENINYMILGARRKDDKGCVLLYTAPNMTEWSFLREITKKDTFGYMWECPDLFILNGKRILSVSPQGVEKQEYAYQNIYQSGYFYMEKDWQLSDFFEWDMGFDFYAPQTFLDEKGRRILIGWAGMPDADYTNPTVAAGWQHALTVPRELTMGEGGKVLQYPVAEISKLRMNQKFIVKQGADVILPFRTGDLEINKMQGDFCIHICHDLRLYYRNGILKMEFIGNKGYGRTVRKAKISEINSLRLLMDTSLIEIYINKGAYVFTTRYYPDMEKECKIKIECNDNSSIHLWYLKGMEVLMEI